MCGRIVYVWDPVTKELVLKMIDDPEMDPATKRVVEKKRYNVPPSSHLPVLTRHGGKTNIAVARWGFPITKRPNGVFNTRVESAFDSPMWASMMGQSHCLFPVKGFYEWRRESKSKRPFYVHRNDGQDLLLAGLYGQREWQGDLLSCASILTCEPNAVMADVHDRMPVIIEAEQATAWLDADVGTAKSMAIPADDNVLTLHEVGPAVGDTKNDRPELMQPIESQGLGAFT